jgi:hypothetical protein
VSALLKLRAKPLAARNGQQVPTTSTERNPSEVIAFLPGTAHTRTIDALCAEHGLKWAQVDTVYDGGAEARRQFLIGVLLEADGASLAETFADLSRKLTRLLVR